jgi:hypothetical protein
MAIILRHRLQKFLCIVDFHNNINTKNIFVFNRIVPKARKELMS